MFRELRWRLTGVYMVLLLGALLLFSAGTYFVTRAALMENFDEVLVDQGALVAQAVDIEDGIPELKQEVLLSGHRNDDHFTRLYSTTGAQVFDDTADGPHVPNLPAEVMGALRGQQSLVQIEANGETLRVATFPILHKGEIAGVLQVGVSLADIEYTLWIILIVLLVMAPITVLLASGGGLVLANRALTPIDVITRTAQRISAESLSGRIHYTGPNDEVGRLARTFDTMLARLEAAFDQQRQFAADASHELRTPLTAIIGQIDVALGWPESVDYYRATLSGIREQAQRLTRLASDLLFLARADAQPMPYSIEPIELANLIPAVVAQLEPVALERKQSIIVTPSPKGTVYGNEDDLIRLLVNILDNALRYTPAGGKVTLSCHSTTSTVEIRVRDTGPGIAPEYLPRVFDRFYRIDKGRSRMQGGSGLGLAIAQTIAQMHGGEIAVESVVGQGSTFSIRLPSVAMVRQNMPTGAIAAMPT